MYKRTQSTTQTNIYTTMKFKYYIIWENVCVESVKVCKEFIRCMQWSNHADLLVGVNTQDNIVQHNERGDYWESIYLDLFTAMLQFFYTFSGVRCSVKILLRTVNNTKLLVLASVCNI